MGAGVVLNRKNPDKGLSEVDCHRPCRRHNSVDGNVVRLRRNYLGLQYLVVENHRNDRGAGGAVRERAVVPASSLAEASPVRGRSERRNDDQIRLLERLRAQHLTARLSGWSPERHQRLARLSQSPARYAEGSPGLVEEDREERTFK